MNIKEKKLRSGFALPELGLGTWGMGGQNTPDTTNDDEDIEAIIFAVENGIKHIDTAELYGEGHAEELIATAISQGKLDRSKLIICSKVLDTHQGCEGVKNACEKSLRRLKMDYIDLYLLHAYPQNTPLAESIEALNDLITEDKVRHIGVSNFTTKHLQHAMKNSDAPIVCNQVYYNLKIREAERIGLIEFCQQNDCLLSAYRPMEEGNLLSAPPSIVSDIADKYGMTPAQVAINWLVSQDNIVTLVKSSNKRHMEENMKSLDFRMDAADIEKLRKDFPGQITSPQVEFS